MNETDTQRRDLIGALYRKYHAALRRFLARKGLDREEVADIVLDTYNRVYQYKSAAEIRNPKAFLFRVANNLWINGEKRKHRRIGVEGNALDISTVEVASEAPSAYRALKGEQELAIVRAAIEELPAKCRQAFVMNRFENMTYGEIAAELGVSVSMIEKHVSHAISHLRQKLNASRQPLEVSAPRRSSRHE
ncbi:RNA polymerase sigma factor [Microbulbifer sp.]|uniref:RNA polymerase sigma factor n=1 Tax=Microbulbifer sp. TaxID=1908541 RepID=UPI003F3A6FC2